MYCHKCGKENLQDSIFCKYCGTKIEDNKTIDIKTSDNINTTTISQKQNKKNIWESLGSIIGMIVGYLIGRALGLTFFLLVIGWLIGYYFAKWFIKNHQNSKFFSFIAWFNLISWLSPILGFFTAGITFIFAQQKKQKKYYILLIIAVILAVISALLYRPNNTGYSDFKVGYRTSFIDSCKKSSGGNIQVCTCTANYLIKNYTETQLTEYSMQYKTSGQLPQALKTAVSVCVGTNSNSN